MSRTSSPKGAVAKGHKRLHVVSTKSGWQIRREGSGRMVGVYSSQSEATDAAKLALRRSGGELMVQGRDGRFRESITLGRDAMAKIAAVEGIYLSRGMKRTLRDLDRKGASSEERRGAIVRQFGKKA